MCIHKPAESLNMFNHHIENDDIFSPLEKTALINQIHCIYKVKLGNNKIQYPHNNIIENSDTIK